jgi:1-acyl-sn-glycerol-3-phosphate acyltransferase
VLVQAPAAAAVTTVLSLFAILVGAVDRSGRGCRAIAGIWSRALLRIGRIRVGVEGLEHLPQGPAVYAANHGSALDIPIVFGHLPVDFRIIHKRSLRLLPLLGQAMWAAGHIAIDRSHPFRARRSLVAAARRIRAGTSVIVFPEGTRSPDATVRRFKRGSFALAIDADVPVVPVSLAGVKAIVPRGLFSLRPGTVRILVHAPLPVAGRSPEDAEALAEEVRQVVAAGCRPRAGSA